MIELGKQDRASELCALAGERQKLAGDKPRDLLALSYDLERAFRAVRRGPTLDKQHEAKTAAYQQLAVELFREAGRQSPRDAQRFAQDKARENMHPYYRLVELDGKIALNPENWSSLLTRARWLQQLDDMVACKQDREQALPLLNEQSGDAEALKYRGWFHFDEERWDEAVRDLTAALIHQPTDFLLLRLRAAAYMRLANWQGALDDYAAIFDLLSDPAYQLSDWPARCCALMEMGSETEALAAANGLVELAKMYPKHTDTLVSGFMLRRAVPKFPEATLALANQAIHSHPKEKNVYLGELGGVRFYLGQYSDAVKNLEPNAADSPSASSASAGFWLAMSLHHLGEFDKAQAAFRRAVRNWKGMAALQPEVEKFLQALWSEAASLLATEAPSSN
jgi:tetratricopeptide (TPR) repeat protein